MGSWQGVVANAKGQFVYGMKDAEFGTTVYRSKEVNFVCMLINIYLGLCSSVSLSIRFSNYC